MRVLNVNATLDRVDGGGTAERTFHMSASLAAVGCKCTILTLDAGLVDETRRALAGVRIVALPCGVRRFGVPRTSLRTIRDLVSGTDVIHIMNHWSILNALVYVVARDLEKPYVVCPAGALPLFGRSKVLKKLYNWAVGHRIVRNANAHIAVTPAELPHYADYGVAAERVAIFPNGIRFGEGEEGDPAAFRRRHGLGDDPFVLFVGRLNAIKGPDLLVRAFCEARPRLGRYRLVLAGPDAGMLRELRAMVARADAEAFVHFVGYVGGEEKAAAYRAASLVAIPSRQDAMPIVILEAATVGTPVLLTEQCGFDAGACAALTVPATAEGFRDGLIEMLADPAGLRASGERLKAFIQERYDWKRIVTRYLEMYEALVASGTWVA